MSLKIVFIGDLNIYTESKSKLDGFLELGWDVRALSSQTIPHFPGLGNTNNFFQRARRKIYPMYDPTRVNAKLREMALDGSLQAFDLLWSDKAINILPETYSLIQEKVPSLKLIFASGDNMAIKNFRNRAFEQTLPVFDAVITTKSWTLGELKNMGARSVFYIPKAFDANWCNFLSHPPKRWDISFVGSFEEQRAHSLLTLAKAGFQVDVWGNGWKKCKHKNHNLTIHDYPVYHGDLIRIIEETKINLCFLRKLAKDKSTNRTFEIPACGGFMLAEETQEQQEFFIGGKHAAYFDSDNGLVSLCDYFLKNFSIREVIAKQGHAKCLSSGYSYVDRCTQFYDEVWPLIKD